MTSEALGGDLLKYKSIRHLVEALSKCHLQSVKHVSPGEPRLLLVVLLIMLLLLLLLLTLCCCLGCCCRFSSFYCDS